jgi:hypothetical protein
LLFLALQLPVPLAAFHVWGKLGAFIIKNIRRALLLCYRKWCWQVPCLIFALIARIAIFAVIFTKVLTIFFFGR